MQRHRTDVLSLLFGGLFTVIGLASLLEQAVPLNLLQAGWALPAAAVVAGVWLMVSGRDPQRGDDP
jgi:hypothetical protein